MSKLFRIALTGAVATSGFSLYDAAYNGLVDGPSPFSDDSTIPALATASAIVFGLTCAALAAVLVLAARTSTWTRVQRWPARLLGAALGILAVLFTVVLPVREAGGEQPPPGWAVLEAIGGSAFFLMFLLAFVLGIALLRRPEQRPAAVLLVAVAPVLGLTVLIAALGSDFAHPAYAESVVYLGVALLASPTARPHRHEVAVEVPESATASATTDRQRI